MIICAAIKDTRTGAVFGGIRHGFIYSAMHDAGITPPHEKAIEGCGHLTFFIIYVIIKEKERNKRMTDYEIELPNKLIENCIYCGGDLGGPYYTDVEDTELAIKIF